MPEASEWTDVAEFFAMGGYAVYVWPALGLTAAVMIGLAWQSWRRLRREEVVAAELEMSLKFTPCGGKPIRREDGTCGLSGGA